MKLEGLPPLRESLAEYGLLPRKSFGQHFLLDLNVTAKIARLAGPLEGRTVIEVGPGPGGLTRALLAAGAEVIAVEKDARFLDLLGDLAACAEGRLQIVHADALKVDESALLGGREGVVVSNLPYNVGTPLLVKWIAGSFRPASLTLMFQKEVARRIVAAPGSGDYGRLSVLVQAGWRARIVMDLPARAFTPPPKVDSAVVRLDPLPDRPSPETLSALEKITAAAFGQRRKMLRSSLKALGGENLAHQAGLDPSLRAEALTVEALLALANAYQRENR